MNVTINGDTVETAATTLAAILAELDMVDAVVATALNGAFVPARERLNQRVADGDRIEIVAPMQGG